MKIKSVLLQNIRLQLLPEKVVVLPDYETLCIADWHMGKAAHFRKAGIPMPQPDLSKEFDLIVQLIEKHSIKKVILLGDVFHSNLNNDWLLFANFIESQSHIEWIVTMGNHDIIGAAQFQSIGIFTTDVYALSQSIICTHHPMGSLESTQLNLCGHVHPGCEIVTFGRQRFRFPCFHYRNSILTLPAFGGLTGLFIVKQEEKSKIFAILGDEVKEIRR